MPKPKNPCAKNCPKRRAGCAVGCGDWDKYVEQRDAWYIERSEAKKMDNIMYDRAIKRKIRRMKEGYE